MPLSTFLDQNALLFFLLPFLPSSSSCHGGKQRFVDGEQLLEEPQYNLQPIREDGMPSAWTAHTHIDLQETHLLVRQWRQRR